MTTTRSASATTVVVLFAIAYALAVLCIGILPVNLMVARFAGVALWSVWLSSLRNLLLRTLAAGVACWIALRVTGRATAPLRARSTRGGMLVIGALASGALAGVLDVVAHRLFVRALVGAARVSPLASVAVSLCLAALSAGIIALLCVVRGTRVRDAEPATSA